MQPTEAMKEMESLIRNRLREYAGAGTWVEDESVRLITREAARLVVAELEKLGAALGTNDATLRNEPWLTKEIASDIDAAMKPYKAILEETK